MTTDRLESSFKELSPSSRRNALRFLAVASLGLAGAAITGCANMRADPKKPRPRSHITGKGGGPGGNK